MGNIKVKMLKDIPAYNGVDDLRFGPFKAGMVAELPESEARWMITGKLAESIGPLPLAPVAIGLMDEARASVKLDGETQSEPEPRKRKKYTPRQGMACPSCGENLRTCFATLNQGGLRAIMNHGACPKCNRVYRIALLDVEAVKA